MKAIQDTFLEKCHIDFLDICFSDFPIHEVHSRVSDKVTGYGTNINEKIQSLNDFIDLLNLQREESEGLQMKSSFNRISKTVFSEGRLVIFVDEGIVSMTIENKQLDISVRISSVYEYDHSEWLVIHFHGSIPQGVEGDRDTWAVNEWKEKNEQLEKIIEERTFELKQSIANLKAAQAQLIQAEKMASLGELTAGIAHEIQNPLNFVNNFSEVNKELLQEMNEEIENGNFDEVKALAKDVVDNEDKIIFHGKRADSIVKGMLQHSRSSSSEKEPTDINMLADEYLRLAYHGLRAKDKSFNATTQTDFDTSIGKINVVPQDIGRVILNLLTNAFYAVHQKSKENLNNFEPTVNIITKKTEDMVILEVKDNGNGIPNTVREKIFQPFFTTKPTGQGTGLGLSLSYDIITNGHGGKMHVESKEGDGATIIINLPLT